MSLKIEKLKIKDDNLSINEIHEIEIFKKDTALRKRIDFFSQFPYTDYPFSKRNWGHNLHTLCSYQSRLKASMAYYLIQSFSKPGDKILDPFSGVGTIPFEACLNGRQGFGVDINPVAYHVSLAKIQIPKKEDVLSYLKKLERHLEKNKPDYTQVDDYTRQFYHPKTLDEILVARDFFMKTDKKIKDSAFSFLFSCMLHILHGNRPYALSRRSHNLIPLKPTGPTIYKSVIESCLNKINLSFKKPLPKRYKKGDIKMGSVLDLPYKKEYFDSILTSPPFWSSTRFYANNRIRLWFCGWKYKTQERKGRLEFFEELQKENIAVYQDVFSQFYNVLKPGGVCVIHLGVVPNLDIGKEIIPYAKKSKLKFVDLVYEDIKHIEKHGMKDQGITKAHEFLILKKS